MLVDPVCGMRIDAENAPAFSTYQEHTYYFCCDNCKQQFDADPEKYINNAQQSDFIGEIGLAVTTAEPC